MSERKPLTLEELRKMDGKPVWCKYIGDTTFPDQWMVVNAKMGKCGNAEWELPFEDNPDNAYGKTWLAYATEPPRFDRSAWEPCEHCKPSKNPLDRWGPHQFPIDGNEIYCYDTDEGWEGEEINFCPWCSRPLTDAAWDMLEKRLEGARK